MTFNGSFNLDTHAFIKSFINAKNKEEEAELIIRNISAIQEENLTRVNAQFDKMKDELVTKSDLHHEIALVRKEIKELEYKITIKFGAMMAVSIGILLAALPLLINKH
jgi:hypothetical protein